MSARDNIQVRSQLTLGTIADMRQRQMRRNRLFAALAIVAVLAVALALMMPAFSMTRGSLVCGLEEHVHTQECYAGEQLICGKAEHEHSTDCYESAPVAEPESSAQVAAPDAAPDAAAQLNTAPEDAESSALDTASCADASSAAASNASTSVSASAGSPARQVADAQTAMPAQTLTQTLESDTGAGSVRVKVKAPEGALPAGTTLKLTQVTNNDAIDAAIDEASGQNAKRAARLRALAVDVAFFDAGQNRIEPARDVKVTFETPLVSVQDALSVVHIANDFQAETVAQDDVQVKPAKNQVVFQAGEFSVYALVYTVHFEYARTVQHLAGGASMLLSQLLEGANAGLRVEDVENVAFTAPDLLAIERVSGEVSIAGGPGEETTLDAGAGDWLLTSVGPFTSDEMLVVSMNDGTTHAFKVTDAQYLSDISDLLVEQALIVDGQTIKPGQTAYVKDGVTYSLKLKFKETIGQQFSNEGPLTYTMPEGFELPEGFTTTLQISLGRRGKLYCPVTYDKATRTLSISWDKSNPALFSYFEGAATAAFELDLQGTVDVKRGEVLFKDDVAINVEKQDLHNAKVSKEGELDAATGTISYTVTVTSDGTTENLVLTDEPGSALVYLQNCAFDNTSSYATPDEEQSWKNHRAPVISNRGTGFSVKIASMADGEKLVFRYSCRIDVNNIEQSGHATFEETGNTASIAGDDVPEDNQATHWEDAVEFSDLEKDITGVGGISKDEDGVSWRTLSWQIDTNKNPMLSFAGTAISDTIGEDVQSLCAYSGSGIVVKVYDASHTLVDTRQVSWSELGCDPATDKTWTYRIPADDTLPYEYVVEYDTVINQDLVNSAAADVYVTNYAQGKGGEDVAMEIIHPQGTGLGVSKRAKGYTVGDVSAGYNADGTPVRPGTVEWEVTIHLENGNWDTCQLFTELSATDIDTKTGKLGGLRLGMPSQWDGMPGNQRQVKEVFDSLEVIGLQDGESYKVNSNPQDKWNPDQLSVEFFKTGAQTDDTRGLNAPEDGSESRDVKLVLKTTYDPAWITDVAALHDYGGRYNHINIADVGRYYSAKDPAKPREALEEGGARATDKVSPRGTHTVKRVLMGYENVMDPANKSYANNYPFRVIQDWTLDPADGAELQYPQDQWNKKYPETGDPDTLYPISGSIVGTGYGGHVYPLIQYQVAVTGVETDEPIVITDTFDTSIFKLWTAKTRYTNGKRKVAWSYFEPTFGAYDTGDWIDASAPNSLAWKSATYPGDSNPSVDESTTVELTEDGVTFTIGNPPKKADGTYYNSYLVQYYLIPKNEAALQAISKAALQNGSKTGVYEVTYPNTATARGMSDEAQVTWPLGDDFKPVGKTMTQVPQTDSSGAVITAEDGSPVMSNKVDCEIRLNPGKMRLNDGNAMYMTDTYSDTLAIDYTSIAITTDPDTAANDISYDFSGNVGTFLIPDETAVTIRYTATVLSDGTTSTPIFNEAAMLKYSDRSEQDVTFKSSSTSSVGVPEISLYKYGAGHMETGLAGAVFKLYEVSGTGTDDDPYTYTPMHNTAAKGGGEILFTTGQDGMSLITLTQTGNGYNLEYSDIKTKTVTSANGKEQLRIDWDASVDEQGNSTVHLYALEEVQAPLGYEKASFKYRFAIVPEGMIPVYGDYVFTDGETMTARNAKKTAELTITKTFAGNAAQDLTEEEKAAITFSVVNDDDEGSHITKVVEQDGVETEVEDTSLLDIPYSSFTNGSYTLDNLPAGRFKVIEQHAAPDATAHPGWTFATTYSFDGLEQQTFTVTDEDIENGESFAVDITNTYTKPVVELQVAKKWQDTFGDAMAWPGTTPVTIELYALSAEGDLSPVLGADGQQVAVTLDGIKDNVGEARAGVAVFRGLSPLSGGARYVAKERSVPDGYDVVYSDGGYSAFAASGNAQLATIANRQQATQLQVYKSWLRADGSDVAPTGASAVLRLYAYAGSDASAAKRVTNVSDIELDGEADEAGETGPWTATFANLPITDKNGNELTYVAREQRCTPGYEANYPDGQNYAGEKQSVANRPATQDFTFSKQWVGTPADPAWPEGAEIQVTVGRWRVSGESEEMESSATFTLSADACTRLDAGELGGASAQPDWGNATFALSGLPKYEYADDGSVTSEWEYRAGELPLAGFDTTYKQHGVTVTDATVTGNGGIIVNTKQEGGIALPSTGGPGTAALYALGVLLMLAAAGLLAARKIASART